MGSDRHWSQPSWYNEPTWSEPSWARNGNPWGPKEPKKPKTVPTAGESPPLPGVAQNGDKPKIILAQDISYPPFAFLGVPPEGDYELAGVVVDVVKGMNEICDLDIVTVQT